LFVSIAGRCCEDCELILHPVYLCRFSGYTFASNVLLNARLDQWPGMALASFVGYVVSELTSLRLDSSASSVISAFAVGITGVYSSCLFNMILNSKP